MTIPPPLTIEIKDLARYIICEPIEEHLPEYYKEPYKRRVEKRRQLINKIKYKKALINKITKYTIFPVACFVYTLMVLSAQFPHLLHPIGWIAIYIRLTDLFETDPSKITFKRKGVEYF